MADPKKAMSRDLVLMSRLVTDQINYSKRVAHTAKNSSKLEDKT